MLKNKVFKIKLKKGDLVVIRRGRLKNQTGRILATYPRLNKVMIENLNLIKKHRKPTKLYPQGGILEIAQPIATSKVALVEPSSKQSSRIGYQFKADGSKARVYKKTGKIVKSVVAK